MTPADIGLLVAAACSLMAAAAAWLRANAAHSKLDEHVELQHVVMAPAARHNRSGGNGDKE